MAAVQVGPEGNGCRGISNDVAGGRWGKNDALWEGLSAYIDAVSVGGRIWEADQS